VYHVGSYYTDSLYNQFRLTLGHASSEHSHQRFIKRDHIPNTILFPSDPTFLRTKRCATRR